MGNGQSIVLFIHGKLVTVTLNDGITADNPGPSAQEAAASLPPVTNWGDPDQVSAYQDGLAAAVAGSYELFQQYVDAESSMS
jgi:hypothetical protein